MNQEKKKIFEAHLEQKNKKRQQQLEQKKIEESNKNNPREDMLFIQKTFREKQKQFEDLSAEYKQKKIPYSELQNSFNLLKQYFLEINYVLMTYDRQFYKQFLEKHYNSMIELKKKFEPRKKFKFARRDEDFGVKLNPNDVKIEQKHQQFHSLSIPGISGKSNQKITINNIQTVGPYKITQSTGCQINLENKSQILFLKELTDCRINCALTKSTVFVDNCKNCIFELNCHQLRIHNTYDTTFGIFVTSKAIIQDCNRVIFTPYTYSYTNRKQDEISFERVNETNQWKQIQDFNWLKENQKSPHYQLKENL